MCNIKGIVADNYANTQKVSPILLVAKPIQRHHINNPEHSSTHPRSRMLRCQKLESFDKVFVTDNQYGFSR